MAVAAYCLALAGRNGEARALMASIRRVLPHYPVEDFLAAFRFDRDGATLFREAARRIAMA
jgi:hypothetical protein